MQHSNLQQIFKIKEYNSEKQRNFLINKNEYGKRYYIFK
ncbi:hypothetical protein M124_4112 [Bacteroides fragilis str. 3988T(B)14]|uniref:Uncharacterized protein n=1 Tax=Bacteroides fragilis str. 3988T(B)14 TaxID=1339315 RepID=A0A015SXW4_BACFG|nr:hypothetical protein M124_4112 [Bacteroides fragilis str. 3988T(B)14]EXY78026.1 hypothetical protein M084_4261 [Bacteroides fragilis str. 3988 T1]